MGHASGSMSEQYDYVSIDEQRQEMEKLQYLIEAPKKVDELSIETLSTEYAWQEKSNMEEG